MFLVRKFSTPNPDSPGFEPSLCPVIPHGDWGALPPDVHDVMVNIQLMLRAKRRYDHLLPDYGLSASHGQLGGESQVELIQDQFPETIRRYEPRFLLEKLDFDVSDEGVSFMKASGSLLVSPGALRFAFTVNGRTILSVHFTPSRP